MSADDAKRAYARCEELRDRMEKELSHWSTLCHKYAAAWENLELSQVELMGILTDWQEQRKIFLEAIETTRNEADWWKSGNCEPDTFGD